MITKRRGEIKKFSSTIFNAALRIHKIFAFLAMKKIQWRFALVKHRIKIKKEKKTLLIEAL